MSAVLAYNAIEKRGQECQEVLGAYDDEGMHMYSKWFGFQSSYRCAANGALALVGVSGVLLALELLQRPPPLRAFSVPAAALLAAASFALTHAVPRAVRLVRRATWDASVLAARTLRDLVRLETRAVLPFVLAPGVVASVYGGSL